MLLYLALFQNFSLVMGRLEDRAEYWRQFLLSATTSTTTTTTTTTTTAASATSEALEAASEMWSASEVRTPIPDYRAMMTWQPPPSYVVVGAASTTSASASSALWALFVMGWIFSAVATFLAVGLYLVWYREVRVVVV